MKTIHDVVLDAENLNCEVEVFGWIRKVRKLGSLIFLDMYDISGFVQVVIDNNNPFYETIIAISKESVIRVKGQLKTRSSINNEIPTGHVEIILNDFEVLSKANPIPFLIQEHTDGLEDLRLKYRYLDLRRSNMQKTIILRSNFFQRIREFLYREKMIEIETPILSRKTPEGANGYLVPVKNNLYFSLAQSPQVYKQLLMTAGFMKYFQIARCFRDEDLRLDRQPEFTQLDLELSFTNEEEIYDLIERLLKDVFLKTLNVCLNTPFERISYDDAMNLYGIDKPNTGYEFKIFNATELLKKSIFFEQFISQNKEIKAIIINDYLIEKQHLKQIEKFAKDNDAKSLISALYENGKVIGGSLFGKVEDEFIKDLFLANNVKKGTIFFDFSPGLKANKILGAIRNAAIQILDIPRKNKYNFAWVVEWPLFEFSESENKYVSSHHPFTAPSEEYVDGILENYQFARARSYDIVLNGFEVGGGSIRINDKDLQEKIFKILNIPPKKYIEEFGFLLDAFQYGTPPHGGIAFGLDRIMMIISNGNSIRDVIAFPKNSAGFDLTLNAPGKK
ncbi:MAG: aspartate--tRNA ligase [Mycoplasmoidaceae bacterium]